MKAILLILPVFILALVLNPTQAKAQTSGNNTFEFLSLTNSARIAALGGNMASIRDKDLSLALPNPSLISPEMNNELAFSYVNYYTDINLGYAAYARSFKNLGTYTASLQFLDYGKFNYADATGATAGSFNVGDYSLNLGWGRNLDSNFSIGANLKLLYSDLEAYNSFGMAVDVAGSYFPDKNTCMSLVFANVGRQITSYSSAGVQPLPFEIQFGVSRRLAHLPFRFSLLLQHLEKWDLTHLDAADAEIDPFTGLAVKKSSLDNFTDKAMRHIVLGGEFVPAKFLSFRFGYNYLRRQELKLDSRPGTAGFSWGIGLKISKFRIDYSRATYHLVGARNYVTLTTHLSDWVKQ
ncbi:MAG: type IX secretion system protein PorQ [Bacteroidales bacterium]|nr:type IX secretion system protein PorQ [Bacteroidales bacterium]